MQWTSKKGYKVYMDVEDTFYPNDAIARKIVFTLTDEGDTTGFTLFGTNQNPGPVEILRRHYAENALPELNTAVANICAKVEDPNDHDVDKFFDFLLFNLHRGCPREDTRFTIVKIVPLAWEGLSRA